MSRRTLARVLVCAAVLGGGGVATETTAAAAVCPGGVNAVTDYSYSIVAPDGTVTGAARLGDGAVRSGDTVTVTFTVAEGCVDVPFVLVTYTAPARPVPTTPEYFTAQRLFDVDEQRFSAGTHSLTATVPTVTGIGAACTNEHVTTDKTYNGNGSPGPDNQYASTCDGSPSLNGNGNANGGSSKPCAGCVGNADNKNPKGQAPNGGDANAGYECDRNSGVGRSNPAHTWCGAPGFQIDFARGRVIVQLDATTPGGLYGNRLIDWAAL